MKNKMVNVGRILPKIKRNKCKLEFYICFFRFMCYNALASLLRKLHMEVSSWLLLLPTSACPAAHAQHSALLKLSLWAIFIMRSTPTSALSAAHVRLSALQRLLRVNRTCENAVCSAYRIFYSLLLNSR